MRRLRNVLLPFALLTVAMAFEAGRARLDVSNDALNANTPELERDLQELRRTFGADEVLVVTLTADDLLDPPGLARLDRLTRRVGSLDGVARVVSLTNVVEVVAGDFGAEERPLLPPADSVTAALDRNPQLTGLLISTDRRTAGVLAEVEPRPGDDGYRARLVEALRELEREFGRDGAELHLTGITVQKTDSSHLVQRDRRVLLPASALVLAASLWIATRRRSGVLLPLLVTAASLAWTLGPFALAGYRVNIITSLLPPVIMVLSITTSLHVYQEWVALGDAARAMRTMARPIVLTAATTALGFGSLAVSEVPAVRQFGLFAALGVLVAMVFNLTLMPAVLSTLRPPAPRHDDPGSRLRPWLVGTASLAVRRPGLVMAVAAGLTLAAVAGTARIESNTDLVRFLAADSELRRDTMFVDEHLMGANALELMVARSDGGALTSPADMRRLETFVERLESLEAVTSTLAIPRLVAQIHRAEHDLPRDELPDDEADLLSVLDLLEASGRREDIARLITPGFERARVALRIHAIGTREGLELLRAIRGAAAATLGDAYRVTPTGEFYRVIVDSTHLVTNQLRSFALALATVFLAIGLSLRDPRLLLAAAVPNLLPIVWASGLMGWVGIDLSVATAMVASVVIGIAVDGTIHFLERFRRLRERGIDVALRETTLRTGRVVAMASLVLAVGFWIGALGSFRPTVYFSLLTGGTILFALICDLLVLPACLKWIVRSRPGSAA